MNQDEKENPIEIEGLKEQLGECLFCGQTRMITPLLGWTTLDMNEEATKLCQCREAKRHTEELNRRITMQEAIEHMTGEHQEDLRKVLNASVDLIASFKVKKVTVTVDDTRTITIDTNSDGKYRIENKIVKKNKVEG